MTVETKTDLPEIETAGWAESPRQGDRRGWVTRPEPNPDADDEDLSMVSPQPISWPRVFPGL